MKPLVSIIIPYLEDRGWLNEAVRSVEKQTFRNFELILSKGNKHRGGNVNSGIIKSRGKFIKLLDEDDMLMPECLELSMKVFHSWIMKRVYFIHANACYFNTTTNQSYIYHPEVKLPEFNDLIRKNVICNATVMYRREMFHKIGLFDESLYRSEDFDMHLRALKHGCRIGYVNKEIVWYRLHDKQVSVGKDVDLKKRAEIRKLIISKYL